MSSASKRRQSGGEDEGGGANWMDTYGDLVTLLLCFFVLLFSFSSIDAAKWEALAGALSGASVMSITPMDANIALDNPITPITPRGMPDPRIAAANQEAASGEQSNSGHGDGSGIADTESDHTINAENYELLVSNIRGYISTNGLNAEIKLNYENFIVTVSFGDSVFFNSGDAIVLPESIPVLEHVAQMFSESQDLFSVLRIEGHTDDVPITGRYPSNWELSTARATNVLQFILLEDKIDLTKIAASGYSEYHPIDTNETAEGRAKNRRVDFVAEGYR